MGGPWGRRSGSASASTPPRRCLAERTTPGWNCTVRRASWPPPGEARSLSQRRLACFRERTYLKASPSGTWAYTDYATFLNRSAFTN